MYDKQKHIWIEIKSSFTLLNVFIGFNIIALEVVLT